VIGGLKVALKNVVVMTTVAYVSYAIGIVLVFFAPFLLLAQVLVLC
jgi:ABC-type transport system involved in cytochrome bd biosynthesis fused ATPase/permease subunit